MKSSKIRAAFLMFVILMLLTLPVQAETRVEPVEIAGGTAKVTFLEGKVTVVDRAIPLKVDDLLFPGDRVSTGEKARVELKLPDGSFIRFDEQTSFELVSARIDRKKKERKINVSMTLGKTWAKVSKLFGRRGRFEVTTKTAICGVRGTVYRLNVNPDNSVMVRVYWGEIVVSSPMQRDIGEAGPPAGKITRPSKVPGPRPAPGPHPVTLEEWTYIVKALQQINIRPDGTATKPFRFDIKEDLNDWVLWNQERDKIAGD